MNFHDCMQTFGEAFGLAAFAPAADGRYRIAVRDLPIAFRAEADGKFCVMTADIGDVSGEGADVFLKEVFGAMFMNSLGPGRWFSSEEGSAELQFNGRLDLEPMDGGSFIEAADRFAALACSWRDLAAQWRVKCRRDAQDADVAAVDVRV